MADEAAFQQATAVQSIAEEYQHLRRQHCPCGGHYKLVTQCLVKHNGKPYDVLDTTCPGCGARRTFVFDVSAFYGSR